MTFSLRPVIFALAGIVLVGGCRRQGATPVSSSGGLVKLRLQTDWYPQPEHGGYYEAAAKGYYAEEGLEVEIIPGGPNAQVMASVATGRAEMGMTNGDDVIVAIARGIPIKMVAAEMQRDAQAIMYHEEHPVHDLAGLDGRTLMAGAGSVWLQYAQKTFGIKMNILPLVGDLTRFMNDPTYVQQCFVTNEPYFARQRGAKVGVFVIARPGYEPYRVMFTGDAFIKDHPDLVRKFVHASLRGWTEYLTGDAEPANRVILKLRSDLTPEFAAYSIQAMKDYQLVLGDPQREERMGQLTTKRLETQVDILRKLGVLDHAVDVKDIANFDFLPDDVWPEGRKMMLRMY